MAGFTVVVQNAVPMTRLGVATSTLTFLRQIGASVGLAVAGTVFSTQFASRLPHTLAANGVPQQVIPPLLKLSELLQSVGNGKAVLEKVFAGPAQVLIPHIIKAANEALALAIGDLFWVTVVSGLLGLTFTLFLRDRPLRSAQDLRAEAAGAGLEGEPSPVGLG
jgi:hypothetical protein